MLTGPILFPHDGSILAGSVIDGLGPALSAVTPVTILHVDQGVAIEAQAIQNTIERLGSYGVNVSRETLPTRDAASAIVDYARVHDMTMIVMSTQGHGKGGQGERGHVAQRVLSASTVPVLLVPPTAPVEHHSFTNILLPVSAQDESLSVLDTLLPLAQSFKSSITLLHVDSDNQMDTAKQRAKRRSINDSRLEKEFAQTRERVADAGLDVSLRIEHGEADEVILKLAKTGAYDLLAMTTHARTGLSRWVFGSVAQRVLRHCTTPVYLVRTGRGAPEA